jgi:hypothetical protein
MSIQKQLEVKIAAFKSLELAKKYLNKLEDRITISQNKLDRLSFILEKEYDDLENLEKLSIRGLFEKILGNEKAQLEKERQEYLIAALNYNEAKKSLELLSFEKNILLKKLTNYNETKSELHSLIRQREQSLIIEDQLAKQLISDINKKIDANIANKRELQEAILVGLKVKKKFKKIVADLDQVVLWGNYTLNQPDLHLRKMAYVNKARDNAYITKQLLQQFEDELNDIYTPQNTPIQSSLILFRNFIHSFFENLISDWVVLTKIQNALTTIHQVNNKVIKILQTLQHDLNQIDNSLKELKRKKEEIILSLN